MSLRTWRVLAAGLGFLGACGGSNVPGPAAAGGGSGVSAGVAGGAGVTAAQNVAGTSGGTSGVGAGGFAGTGTTQPDGGVVIDPTSDGGSSTLNDPCDYKMQSVQLATDLVIPAGKTVHVCPGVTFTAATDVKIDVLGELIVDGSAEAPVSFLGSAPQPRSWHGLVIESGGKLQLTHGKIGGAIYGLFAMPGSSYAVDTSELSTSFKTAVLQAAGTVSNSKFIASAPPTIAVTDGVTVDDPNGTLTIMDASPAITNCNFDGASVFADLIRVGGQSSATFDHIHVHGAHCGFHTSGGTNSSIHVTNSIFENLSYGIMAYATKPIIESSVFRSNTNDVGVCSGATKANTPVLMNNNYASGSPVVDASCYMIGTTDPSPAATANPSAGPSGL